MHKDEENTTQVQKLDEQVPNDLKLFELEPKVQRYIQMYMTGQYTQAKLAELLGIHPMTATKWMQRADVHQANE